MTDEKSSVADPAPGNGVEASEGSKQEMPQEGSTATPDQEEGAGGPSQESGERFERRWSKRSTAGGPSSKTVVEATPDVAGDLAREKARADELSDRLQRALADLSNYRKRMEADREDMAKFASMLLVAELLPVLDNFARALKTIPESLQGFTWIHGVMLVDRQLRAILERQGVEPIQAVGTKFNPSLHEAIVEEPTTDSEPGTVIEDIQTGYTMHGRVLRPTLAKVAKAPEAAEDAEEKDRGAVAAEPGEAEEVIEAETVVAES